MELRTKNSLCVLCSHQANIKVTSLVVPLISTMSFTSSYDKREIIISPSLDVNESL